MNEREDRRSTRQRRTKRQHYAVSAVALLIAVVMALVSLVPLARALVLSRPKADTETTQPKPVPAEDAKTEEPEKKEEPQQEPADATRDAFISTWAARIDAFDAGTPLEGYGASFAAAAYDCGVDPRYAPAIARVESGSGANCAYSCNAWGWGTSSWGDWDTAIWEFTTALGATYGSTLSYETALSYNSETPDEWYAQVEASMYQIWESGSL